MKEISRRDYEQYLRRRFFEQLVSGCFSERESYMRAEELGLELWAQSYTVVFVSVPPERHGTAESCTEPGARIREELAAHFLKYPEYILFRWEPAAYAALLKGDTDKMDGYIDRCVAAVREQYERYGPDLRWHAAVGTPVRGLDGLPGCFDEASRLWAYRYIFPARHILTADTVSSLTGTGAEHDLAGFDVGKVNPGVVTGVLQSAGPREVRGFVEEYIRSVMDALDSGSFCQYLMLSVRFTATEFVQSLGISQREFLDMLSCLDMVGRNVTVEDMKRCLTDILLRAIELRDRAAGGEYGGLLRRAVDYIDRHFQSGELSLKRVAGAVNVSANYLSAVFSREMKMTFVEYVTERRMEKARELLRSGQLRPGEAAAAVGYRDTHYFSFLFKKIHGCTPGDYRAGKDGK